MLLSVIASGIKKTSDTVLLALVISFLTLAVLCWVLFGFRPLFSDLNVRTAHNKNLTHRIASLQKKTHRSGAIEQRLAKMHHIFVRLSSAMPRTTHEGICRLLEQIHLSGMRLVSWKPGVEIEYYYGIEQRVECELHGSFDELHKLITSLGSFCCRTCTIVRSSHELLVKTGISIYAKKEQLG